jgi:hypothetical protein
MSSPLSRSRRYEEVAAEILGRVKHELGISSVEGKQVVPGLSGTDWELDAKGIKAGSDAYVIIECRRYTTSRLKQEAVAGLAWRIHDTGASGALLVSPLGLQEGAQRVAAAANVVAVHLVVLPRYVRTRSIRNVAPGVRVERGAQAQRVAA